jgi:predicted extracellular nuclease
MEHVFRPRILSALIAAALASLGAGVAQAQSIGTIQGTGHVSTFANTAVSNITGIVTAVDPRGFWIQDGGDGNALTSDGIYVFRNAGSKPLVGDQVRVTGLVQEFRPNGANNLTMTQIRATAAGESWTAISSGNALPAAKAIGPGFLPPSAFAPQIGNIETAPGYVLNPAQYSADFYESLEGMRVSVDSAVAVSPTTGNGEISLLATGSVGQPGTVAGARGGVVVGPGRFNSQRLMIDDKVRAVPSVHMGAQVSGVVGVLDYTFGNYKIAITEAATVLSNPLVRETATIPAGRFGIATYNVENLGGDADPARMTAIASQIKNTLGAPHIVALEEVQDSNGTANDGTVSATTTLNRLTAELNAQTGRNYQYVSVDPQNNTDGGAPGGNIRQAILYDTGRVSFAGVMGGALDSVVATASPTGHVQLNLGAGRIDPTNAAFIDSRKPLVSEFTADGQQLIVIANHFNSKSGDQPLYGWNQPPTLVSEAQRLAQAQVVGSFVAGLLAIDPDVFIAVVGDFNDFQFAGSLQPLLDAGLVNMTSLLPENERYTYNFDGNLQALDHIFVSPGLLAKGDLHYDIVHANAEFFDQLSDHDPLLLTMNLAPVPEPETIAMLLSGLVLVGLRARRRRPVAGR